MILVTVGTHSQGFDRLVKAADDLAARIEEPVVIQRGSAQCRPVHAQSFDFAPGPEMERLAAQARVIISHAAAGSAILALRLGKPLVLVPRRKALSEILDDHQLQLARALAAQGRAVMVTSPSAQSLQAAVDVASASLAPSPDPARLVAALRQTLAAWQPPAA